MTTRIAILDDYQGRALDLADWALLKNCELVPFTMPAADEAELVARLRDFDVVVAMRERTRLGRSVLAQLPRLKLIACTGLRNNAIDRSACADLGIVASGAAGGRNGLATTAETAWALLLALSKRVVESHQHLQEGRWQAQLAQPLETFDLDLDRLVARGFEIRDAIAERLQLFPRGLVGHRHTR